MKKDIIFTLPAEAVEGATHAMLLGDFNNWTPAKEFELEKQPDGSYRTVVQLEAGKTYQYRFLLNDGRWVNDYHAQQYVPADGLFIDNCVITVPEALEDVNDTPQASEADIAAKEEATKTPAKKSSKTSKTDVKEPKAKSPKKVAAKEKVAKPAAEKGKTKKSDASTKAVKKGTSLTKE